MNIDIFNNRNLGLKLSLCFFVWIFSSCEDFLERPAQGQLSSENFFETEEHAVQATNGIYNILRNFNIHVFSYVGVTDIISDDAIKGSVPGDAGFLQELDDFTFDASNTAPNAIWDGYYQGIFRTNQAINNIPLIPEMDEALRNRTIAESRFLRAYFYFFLVRLFGDVPLILEELSQGEFYTQTRTPKEQVYNLIIEDLVFAVENLPAKSEYAAEDLGRATSGAARGMLARVYLTLGDFTNTEAYARSVIESGEYGLFPDYYGIFQREGEHSVESIFEVSAAAFADGGGGSQYNEVQGVRGSPNAGWGFNNPSDNLEAAYEADDPRRDATILYDGEVLPDGSDVVEADPGMGANIKFNQKAWQPEYVGGNSNGPGNIRILRYADILLMFAEAANENGKPAEALEALNDVRERARGGEESILPDVTTTDQAQLREAIWHERRVELAMEQIRWLDLLRQGRAAEVMQALGKDFVEGKHELLPIPQSEIELTGGSIEQNPNW